MISALAESGTALLCAASSSDVALSPKGRNYTMFSEALLYTLTADISREGSLLSFDDIRDSVDKFIAESWRDQSVKPELHIPDQRKGYISKIAFFPNIFGRSAIQQADQLKALSERTAEILLSLSRVDIRLREMESEPGPQQKLNNFEQEVEKRLKKLDEDFRSVDLRLSSAQRVSALTVINGESDVPYHISLEVRKFSTGRRVSRFILLFSLLLLALQIVLSFNLPVGPSEAVNSVNAVAALAPGTICGMALFTILSLGLVFSGASSKSWVDPNDIDTEWKKFTYSIQIANYRIMYYTYIVELPFIVWSLIVLAFVIAVFLISKLNVR